MTAISTNTVHCWTLVHADGQPVGFEDSEPHFDTEEQALKAAADYHDEDRPDPTPKRLDELCSIATAACGYVYDDDGEGREHWPSAKDLHAHLLTVDWRDLPGGEMHCSADPNQCDECDSLIPQPAPVQLPGQLDLISGTEATR